MKPVIDNPAAKLKEGSSKLEEMITAMLPPREWVEPSGVWMQHVSKAPASRLDVINLQENLDKRLLTNYYKSLGFYDVKISSTDFNKLKKCYDLLGVKESDSLDVIKKKYLKVVRDYHPDKIQGKGLPEDFIEFANKKLKDFNEAYNEIKKNKK